MRDILLVVLLFGLCQLVCTVNDNFDKVLATIRPAPVPVAAVAKPDTVWLGCTWVETHDGKVIVKYERLVNPVLWDSMQPVKVRKTKEIR